MKRSSMVLALGLIFGAWTEVNAQNKNPVVVMKTTMGNIKIELFAKKSPKTVTNFLGYVEAKHYDGTIFHRVIKRFMIQGGGFGADRREKKTGDSIKNESKNGVSNKRGTIAMARTSDPDSATAQFYINTVDNRGLDGSQLKFGYAVFGKVIEGMDIVDKIGIVETGQSNLASLTPGGQFQIGPHSDVPVQRVIIRSVRQIKKK